MKNIVLGFFLFLYLSCLDYYPIKVPLDYLFSKNIQKQNTKNLFIFLPGMGDKPQTFLKVGFKKLIDQSELIYDSVYVDAYYNYYAKRVVLERLREDVIIPYQKKGYSNIWIVGLSMGGTGALLYGQKYGEDITGILLIAPFLGDKEVLKEIQAAEKLADWSPALPLDKGDYQRSLWLWIKETVKEPETSPFIYLGFGKNDRLAEANETLAKELAEDRVFLYPGGHDWPPWLKVFASFLKVKKLNEIDKK